MYRPIVCQLTGGERVKELELKAQQDQASTHVAAIPLPCNKDAKSRKLPSFIIILQYYCSYCS